MAAGKNNALGTLLGGLAIVAIGVVIICMNIAQMIENNQPHTSYSELTSTNIKEGMLIEGDLPFNYGAYAAQGGEINNKYYLIETSDGYAMSLLCTNTDILVQLEKQSDDYIDYLNGKIEAAPEAVKIRGKVKNMDTEDKKLITKCLQQSFGFSLDEVTDNTKFYIIEVGNTEISPVVIVIGALMAVGGIVMLLVAIRSFIIKR